LTQQNANPQWEVKVIRNADHSIAVLFKHTPDLTQNSQRIEQVLKDIFADHDVKAAICERKASVQVQVSTDTLQSVTLPDH
jgi:hypothetical protein